MLELASLSRAFGGLVVIDRLDFKVEEGEIVGILGPNGAGKTTLFNMIAGVLPPSSGRILFEERDVTRDASVASLPAWDRQHLPDSKALHPYERFRERARRLPCMEEKCRWRGRKNGSRKRYSCGSAWRAAPAFRRAAWASRHETARTGKGARIEARGSCCWMKSPAASPKRNAICSSPPSRKFIATALPSFGLST